MTERRVDARKIAEIIGRSPALIKDIAKNLHGNECFGYVSQSYKRIKLKREQAIFIATRLGAKSAIINQIEEEYRSY